MKAKTKPVKPVSSRKQAIKNNSKKALIVASITLVITVIIGTLLFNNHQNNLTAERAFQVDKARFAQVEKDMQTAYDAIIATVGKPDKEENGKSCSYTSQKFEQGNLVCLAYIELTYGITDKKLVQNQFLKVNSEISESVMFSRISQENIPNIDTRSSFKTSSVDYSSRNRLDCELIGRSGPIDDGMEYKVPNFTNSAVYLFRCSNVVEAPVYPLAE